MHTQADEHALLQFFASSLGWSELRRFEVRRGEFLDVCYCAGTDTGGRDHLSLDIVRAPVDQTQIFAANVCAIRFRICSGYHQFSIGPEEHMVSEAARLSEWIHRSCFDSLERRRLYRQQHPECSGYTWKRLTDELEPYLPCGEKPAALRARIKPEID